MIISIFLYILFIGLLFVLPDKAWRHFAHYFDFIKQFIKSFIQRMSISKKQKSAQDLLMQLPSIDASLMLKGGHNKEISEYKFFSEIILTLLETNRLYGTSVREHIKEVKKNLMKDMKFEEKLSTIIKGAYFQILAIAITTWIFINIASAIIDVPMKITDICIILSMQILSFICLKFVVKKLEFISFNKFNNVFNSLYKFKLFAEIGMSISQALESSKILSGDLAKFKNFIYSNERCQLAVERWQNLGVSPALEINDVIIEIWDNLEAEFESFNKKVNLTKFLILVCFMLPSYFYFLFGLFTHFMNQ